MGETLRSEEEAPLSQRSRQLSQHPQLRSAVALRTSCAL